MRIRYEVIVETTSKSAADRVMAERLDGEEDYGFPYEVSWSYRELVQSAEAEVSEEKQRPRKGVSV